MGSAAVCGCVSWVQCPCDTAQSRPSAFQSAAKEGAAQAASPAPSTGCFSLPPSFLVQGQLPKAPGCHTPVPGAPGQRLAGEGWLPESRGHNALPPPLAWTSEGLGAQSRSLSNGPHHPPCGSLGAQHQPSVSPLCRLLRMFLPREAGGRMRCAAAHTSAQGSSSILWVGTFYPIRESSQSPPVESGAWSHGNRGQNFPAA